MTFQFDTSGSVRLKPDNGRIRQNTLWSDLSPFMQGYVEAMLTDPTIGHRIYGLGHAFRYFAPETLARIIEDCETWVLLGYKPFDPDRSDFDQGRDFYSERQAGQWVDFPPQTPYLGEDGKVYLK